MEVQQKENYLIIGCNSKAAKSFVKKYKQFNKSINFYGITSKDNKKHDKLFESVFSYEDFSKNNLVFSRILILASLLPSQNKQLSDFINVNKKILDILDSISIKKSNQSRITFISSFSVYKKNIEYIDDNTLIDPQDCYGESKLMMENSLIDLYKNQEFSLAILRMPVFLYFGGLNNFLNKIVLACRNNDKISLFNPQNKLSAVFDIENIIKLEQSSMEKLNIINCGAIPDISFKDIGERAIMCGAKDVCWEFNNSFSTKVDTSRIKKLIGASPSAKQIVDNWLQEEFKN